MKAANAQASIFETLWNFITHNMNNIHFIRHRIIINALIAFIVIIPGSLAYASNHTTAPGICFCGPGLDGSESGKTVGGQYGPCDNGGKPLENAKCLRGGTIDKCKKGFTLNEKIKKCELNCMETLTTQLTPRTYQPMKNPVIPPPARRAPPETKQTTANIFEAFWNFITHKRR